MRRKRQTWGRETRRRDEVTKTETEGLRRQIMEIYGKIR